MNVVTFFPHQSEEELKAFAEKFGGNLLVLSHKPLDWVQHVVFNSDAHFPPPDDSMRILRDFLGYHNTEEIIRFLDWGMLEITDFRKEEDKLKQVVGYDVNVVQEDISVEDFRLEPFMENLLKICADIGLAGTDRLFKDNPKLLVPKILEGKSAALLTILGKFLEIRSTIQSKKFIGILPIFNSEFYV